MKKTLFFISMLTMTMGFLACSNDDDVVEQTVQVQPENKQMTLTAGLDNNITRTALCSDNSVVWSAGDEIMLISRSNMNDAGTKFTLASTSDNGAVGKFVGNSVSDATYYCYYGNMSGKNPVILTQQTYDSQKIISDVPMFARVVVEKGAASDANFKNICGLLKLSLVNSDAKKVRNIRIYANENMAGELSVTYNNTSNAVTNATLGVNATNSIVLDCGSQGVGLSSAATDFYVAMAAKDYSGVKVSVDFVDGTIYEKTLKSGKTLKIGLAEITPLAFTVNSSDIKQHEAVDLGLRVEWATMNIGAGSDLQPGDFYAWGEVTPKGYYSWDSYKWGTDASLSKYNESDRKTYLDSEDDAAVVNWGGEWRMPTVDEFQELIDNCTITWKASEVDRKGNITQYGYYTFTRNNQSIRIPAVGFKNQYLHEVGNSGSGVYLRYWTSNLNTTKKVGSTDVIDKTLGQNSNITGTNKQMGVYSRFYGLPIRPVRTKRAQIVPGQ